MLGRANRLLSPRVRAIATSFPGLLDHDSRLAAKAVHTGNPIRPVVVEAATTPYPDATGAFRVLAFGGSQGARVMADIVPPAMELVPMAVRARLHVTQQAREEDLERVRAAYARMGVPAEVEAFFPDLPRRMAASHIVVSRSGASTVAELAAIGRPAILVPLPHALDQDQRANAELLQKARGAIMFDQSRFTPDRLAAEIARLAAEPEKLAAMAAAARGQGILDAADRLADLVVKVAGIEAQSPRLNAGAAARILSPATTGSRLFEGGIDDTHRIRPSRRGAVRRHVRHRANAELDPAGWCTNVVSERARVFETTAATSQGGSQPPRSCAYTALARRRVGHRFSRGKGDTAA